MRWLLALLLGLCAAPAMAREQWIVIVDQWDNPTYYTLTIDRDGGRITGNLDGDPAEGKIARNSVTFAATNARNDRHAFDGKMIGGMMRGTADFPDLSRVGARLKHTFHARRVPDRVGDAPRLHVFEPKDFANAFDQHRVPVLTIWPGDSVRTSTIDSGGIDKDGRTRALFGNPQTGPFFIAGAESGDTLIVTLKALRLNRDFADSLDALVGRAQTQALARESAELGKPVRWRLDRAAGIAIAEGDGGFAPRVPLRPMLGGIGLAPGFGSQPMSSGDTGRAGGNIDFNEIVAGNRIILPVQQPGALLYIGDAHAAQGDGETSQYALETSMDVEFAVELVKGKSLPMPRVESPTELMAVGQAGSLDEATRAASSGLVAWLRADYGLSLSDAAKLVGAAMRLSIANLAGRSVGVAARIDKALLPPAR